LSDEIAKRFPKGYRGHAIDVGASDGVSVNTTFGLETAGWTVLSVEPNPEFWPALMKERAWVEKCACSNHQGTATLHVNVNLPEAYTTIGPQPNLVGIAYCDEWVDITVRVDTVDHLLSKWAFPKLDALCIDTEGTEQEVLDGFGVERWKPRVIVLESWTKAGHDAYMSERGYVPKFWNYYNILYERR
jgi:FkbM family methyltransferase